MTNITIKTVSTIEEWLQCQQIRAAAFLQTEPYEEEFDGKDFDMAAHILASYQNLPAACMRLRLYSPKNGGTIHWGRLAIMPNVESRVRLTLLNSIADFAADYCDNNGYKTSIGEVNDRRLLKFWQRRGFKQTNEPPVKYGDRYYTKIARYNAIVPFIIKGNLDNDTTGKGITLQ